MHKKLKIKDLNKSFGNRKILNDINLDINDGEFIVLVGPSGSGKSTILRTIAGLEKLNSGEIEINGKLVSNLPPKDRDIAMVFQNYALYPHLTVYENIAFPLKMRRISKSEIKKSVNEAAALLGVESYLNKKPKELSGGERQRVALGRAIVRKPQLFLMDEPLSNLDAKLRTQMRAELLKLHKKLSGTIIYVTHDQIEALTMGDKIIVLDNGSIQQIGSPREIYNSPKNIFVGSFIGTPGMNFFDFRFISDSKFEFSSKIYDLNLPLNNKGKLFGKDLKLGIRPEHISFLKADGIELNAVVELVELLGEESILHLSFAVNSSKVKFAAKASSNLRLSLNSKVTIYLPTEKIRLFDAVSGEKINE